MNESPVSEQLDVRLAAFRAEHEPRLVVRNGQRWCYVTGGAGPPLLLLGGALGQADFSFGTIGVLEADFRVVAPDYPPVASLEAIADGLVALLDREGVERAHVVGGSFGGVVAQAFSRLRPARVASLTLSHTGPPRGVKGAAAAVSLVNLVPENLLRVLFRKRVRTSLAAADPFWLRQFDLSVAALTKREIVSRMRIAAEFGRRFAAAPLPAQVPTLILDSSDDPLIGPGDRESLRALYPEARTHRFEGTGHIAGVLRPVEMAEIIRSFVSEVAAATVGRPR